MEEPLLFKRKRIDFWRLMRDMPNAKDAGLSTVERILLAGKTGTGKTKQVWTLPGRKFAYIFDPNSMSTLRGCDVDYQEFYPDFLEMDATLKGFNKDPKTNKQFLGDRPKKKLEPHVYMKWVDDINEKVEKGFFKDYNWLILDSLTFLSKSVMDRQLFINNRYGDIEELGDYRVVGSKMADVFGSISALPISLYCTSHFTTFQDEKTKKIETQLMLPGKARNILPLMFTNVWLAQTSEDPKGGVRYEIRTRPDPRGLQDVRSSIPNLATVEDVTIKGLGDPTSEGIGGLLRRARTPVQPVSKVAQLRS
jgi:hypothetical protein